MSKKPEKPKTRKAPAAKPDPARSRRYCISRTRNVLIKAHATMGKLGNTLPPDLMHTWPSSTVSDGRSS
jgi:hypothetical protein